jgi:rod shape determining protein RodA
MVIGIFFIYSSGVNSNGIVVSSEYMKQIVWVISGDMLLLIVSFVDYKTFKVLSPWLYLIVLFLLLLTASFGQVVNGSRSWIGIGSLGIQPSEISKLTTILFLSSYLENKRNSIQSLKTFIIALIIIDIHMGLVMIQPDL